MADPWWATSWFGRLGDTYSMLWKMVIRPPRDLYSADELGPAKFRLGRRVYERRDMQLVSSRGVLECSHFLPGKSPEAKRPCVVYLHGNCSSRLEAFDALPVLLPRDITVFCLDLSGSGRSEGEYISLGHHEERDLRVVLQYLRTVDSVGPIGLWGRSMGATTSILRAAEDHNLAACVLDSAFRDLRTVAEELVNRGRFPVPKFIVTWALELIRSEVTARASFDPLQLMPIECAPRALCPALFAVASDDSFVLPHHTQDLHNAWAGERTLRVFEGGHNGIRPTWFLEEAADFLAERLRLKGMHGMLDLKDAPARPVRTLQKEDDEEEDDGTATPRFVSALTESLQLDADVAAGPMSSGHNRFSRDKDSLAIELIKLGFSPEAVAVAVSQFSTFEDAVQWLLEHAAAQQAETDPERSSPGASSSAHPEASRTADPSPRSQSPRAGSPLPPPPRRVGPPGANLALQLQSLGFDPAQSEQAARRALSIEAALDWLVSQDTTVHL